MSKDKYSNEFNETVEWEKIKKLEKKYGKNDSRVQNAKIELMRLTDPKIRKIDEGGIW